MCGVEWTEWQFPAGLSEFLDGGAGWAHIKRKLLRWIQSPRPIIGRLKILESKIPNTPPSCRLGREFRWRTRLLFRN